MFKQHEIQKIRYSKLNPVTGFEFTERDIIPTFVPKDNIKAIDVTGLEEGDQLEMQSMLTEYAEYVKEFQQTMFNFEDWAQHAKEVHIEPKWRTFKIASAKIL